MPDPMDDFQSLFFASAALDTVGHTVLETHPVASLTPLLVFPLAAAVLLASPSATQFKSMVFRFSWKLELLCMHTLTSALSLSISVYVSSIAGLCGMLEACA